MAAWFVRQSSTNTLALFVYGNAADTLILGPRGVPPFPP
jgi:hypothetical protein